MSANLLTKYILASVWTRILIFLSFYFLIRGLHFVDIALIECMPMPRQKILENLSVEELKKELAKKQRAYDYETEHIKELPHKRGFLYRKADQKYAQTAVELFQEISRIKYLIKNKTAQGIQTIIESEVKELPIAKPETFFLNYFQEKSVDEIKQELEYYKHNDPRQHKSVLRTSEKINLLESLLSKKLSAVTASAQNIIPVVAESKNEIEMKEVIKNSINSEIKEVESRIIKNVHSFFERKLKQRDLIINQLQAENKELTERLNAIETALQRPIIIPSLLENKTGFTSMKEQVQDLHALQMPNRTSGLSGFQRRTSF